MIVFALGGNEIVSQNAIAGVTVAGTKQWLNPNAFTSSSIPQLEPAPEETRR